MIPLIQIKGDTVRLCGNTDKKSPSVKLAAFIDTLAQHVEQRSFPGMLIDGMRFVRSLGPTTTICLELPPQVRTVRWLADDSPADYGHKAQYQQVRLAFHISS